VLEASPGEVIHYERIRNRINELNQQFQICEIAIDRWNATQLAVQLDDDGWSSASARDTPA
jgi:phage terminase large subunit-like protein